MQRRLFSVSSSSEKITDVTNYFCSASGAGKVHLNVDRQIIGGADAALGQFPWQAYISNVNGYYLCGGSLILDRWIMTAGHCLQG